MKNELIFFLVPAIAWYLHPLFGFMIMFINIDMRAHLELDTPSEYFWPMYIQIQSGLFTIYFVIDIFLTIMYNG